MQLGTFTRDADKFTGTIATLAIKAKATIQKVAKTNDQAPDYRVYAAGAEIGAAWAKTSEAKRPYLSIKLDDPSFAQPIFCRLVEGADDKHTLIWSR
jgi:uncharacterized protein (DUF736 family)